MGTVEKPNVVLGFSKQRWKSSRKSRRRQPCSISMAAAVSIRPPSGFFFVSFFFLRSAVLAGLLLLGFRDDPHRGWVWKLQAIAVSARQRHIGPTHGVHNERSWSGPGAHKPRHDIGPY